MRIACIAGLAAFALAAAPMQAVALTPRTPFAGETAPHQSSLVAGHTLVGSLRSRNGRFTARVTSSGRLVVSRARHVVWHTHGPSGQHARLRLHRSGNLILASGSRVWWSTGTRGSRATRLLLTNSGRLQLGSSAGRVWTSGVGNLCRGNAHRGKRVDIDLSKQFAKLCAGDQQILTTYITSGATALGDGTPTGTWHLQGKQRNRYLYPAAGGAYYVHYWMPYDGDYGMHDSSWQKFPYGSPKYRRHGSHGCVHFPRAAIARMFQWAPIGTTVHIHS